MIKKSHHGKCHAKDCDDPARDEGSVFCIKHAAARAIRARETPAEVLTMADYSRDPVTGFLHKKIS
jgi:hypothetical protein